MESKIYYFSGTGNSLYVASKLEEKLKLEKIKITNKTIELKEKENIILIAPTYAMGLPLITHRFLKINKEKINKVYFIATHAGMDGAIIKQVQKLTSKLVIGKAIKMSYADTIVKDKDLESNIKKFVLLYNNKKEDIDKVGFFKYHFFNLINKLFLKFGSKKFAQKNFEIDSNKCNKCMTCEKICPVDNIKVNGEVKFTDKCQACQACINWCPKDAIKYKKPGIYKPYKNKDIKLKEILK